MAFQHPFPFQSEQTLIQCFFFPSIVKVAVDGGKGMTFQHPFPFQSGQTLTPIKVAAVGRIDDNLLGIIPPSVCASLIL